MSALGTQDRIEAIMNRIRDEAGEPHARIDLGVIARGVILTISPAGKPLGRVTDMGITQKTRDGVTRTKIVIEVER